MGRRRISLPGPPIELAVSIKIEPQRNGPPDVTVGAFTYFEPEIDIEKDTFVINLAGRKEHKVGGAIVEVRRRNQGGNRHGRATVKGDKESDE